MLFTKSNPDMQALYKKRFWHILLISSIFALFSSTLSYTKFGLYLVYCIAFFLLALTMMRKLSLAYYVLLVVVFNMGEYSRYISQKGFYAFRTVGIAGISFSTIFLFILIGYRVIFIKGKTKPLKSMILRWGLFLLFMAFSMGTVYVLFGYTPLEGFQADLVYFIIFLGSFYLSYGFADVVIVKQILIVSLLVAPIIALLSWFFLPKGVYGGLPISSFDPLLYLTPLIPSFLFFYRRDGKYKIPLWILIISSICSVYLIVLQPSGKSLIFLPISIILAWLISVRKSLFKRGILLGLIVIIVFVAFIPFYRSIDLGSVGNQLFRSKSEQVFSFLNGTVEMLSNSESVYLMASSPRVRALEFLNIANELKEFPVGLIFGRGLGGSFTDKYYKIPFSLGAYSQSQWEIRKFYRVHTSLNFVLLKFGVFGVFIWLLFAMWIIKRTLISTVPEDKILYMVLFFGILTILGYSLKLAMFFGIALGVLESNTGTFKS